MAACLITVSGTSGELIINYKISTTSYSIRTGIGTLYIEDTATAVTYTTLSGDVIASSGCLTITNLAFNCYKLSWKGIVTDNYKFVSVTLGTDTLSIPGDVVFPESKLSLVDAVNSIGDDRIKITQYSVGVPSGSTIFAAERDYIIRVIGTDIPIFKIKNSDNSSYIYLHGVSSACSITGYTDVNICDGSNSNL